VCHFTVAERKKFLEDDLSDALKGLFVGAVVWQAGDDSDFQKGLGFFTSIVQARALYEFYCSPKQAEADDARARDFGHLWTSQKSASSLYRKYMAKGKPANKRVFHLVYLRQRHSGGAIQEHDGPDHIKHQVLHFAKDLQRLTQEFAKTVDADFQKSVTCALQKALDGAQQAADCCKIPNPL
jgi:hypothetical protein